MKEYVELQFNCPDGRRRKGECDKFDKFLRENKCAFIDPRLYDGRYLVGLKVLGTPQSFIDQTQSVQGLLFKIMTSKLEGKDQSVGDVVMTQK